MTCFMEGESITGQQGCNTQAIGLWIKCMDLDVWSGKMVKCTKDISWMGYDKGMGSFIGWTEKYIVDSLSLDDGQKGL